LWFWSLYR